MALSLETLLLAKKIGGGDGSVPNTYRTAAAQDIIDATKIDKPSNPATGAFLVWNGSAWVAQTLATWQGGSY